ncbi:MAG: ATP-binding protein [Clostridia bacterium]|nr:ATP-binding protein [Clostridia bacterium]
MSEFKTYIEQQAELAEKLSICGGISLINIKKAVTEMLSLIHRNGLFEEYTSHTIAHVDRMLDIIEWLIPEDTKKIMTHAEYLMLTLAVYFHDLGMLVSKKEFEAREDSSYKKFKEKVSKGSSEYTSYTKCDDKFLYQEFVRENHAKRIRAWIEGKNVIDLGNAEEQCSIIKDLLSNLDNKFRSDLAMICESHHKDDIDDFKKYKIDSCYGSDKNEKANLNYVAIILRCADLLHITKDRTPSISRRIINVSNPISVLEWEKQQAVKAVRPKKNRNEEGNIDNTVDKDTIEITAYFDGAETAEAYFGLSSYLQYTQKELQKCNSISIHAQKSEGADGYLFPWRKIDDSEITAVGFETKKLQFTLAQENILQLLVGHTLYNDSSVVVREITQNAIDAVKLQNQIERNKSRSITDGQIIVNWDKDKRLLSFTDNGTGMTISEIENYLLTVGASKYRDETFIKEFPNFNSISRFGIGILTCFMVADDVDIITNSEEETQANMISLRKVNGNYLLKKIDKGNVVKNIQKHGTRIELHIRNKIEMDKLESDLRKWIVVPEIPVFLSFDEKKLIRIGYDKLSDVIIDYFKRLNKKFDNINYKIFEKTQGDVSIACALRYNKYLSDWSLMPIDRDAFFEDEYPIGTCVEGIRVEFTTPGYRGETIFAIANIKNSKFKTNVARSALEFDINNQILNDIYSCYKDYIQEQIDNLEKNNFSKSWALEEGNYLMMPLFDSRYNNQECRPINISSLIKSLGELKCLILENAGKREFVAASEVHKLDEFNIVECKMAYAIESLFKEIKSEATLESIINVVCIEDNFLKGIKNVICNYDHSNILHRYALSGKAVSSIFVNQTHRRIHLTFSNSADMWEKFNLSYEFNKYLYIPKKEFFIKGLDDEIGVDSASGIYLRSDSGFCAYIKESIYELKNSVKDNKYLIDSFLSTLFSSRILEKVYDKDLDFDYTDIFDERFSYRRNDSLSQLWSKIDMEKFKSEILTKNLSLFSISNWSRRNDE